MPTARVRATMFTRQGRRTHPHGHSHSVELYEAASPYRHPRYHRPSVKEKLIPLVPSAASGEVETRTFPTARLHSARSCCRSRSSTSGSVSTLRLAKSAGSGPRRSSHENAGFRSKDRGQAFGRSGTGSSLKRGASPSPKPAPDTLHTVRGAASPPLLSLRPDIPSRLDRRSIQEQAARCLTH